MTREIPLTQGYVALVDDADYERVNSFKWYAMSHSDPRWVYAGRTAYPERHTVRLHRFLLDAASGVFVDHLNGDTLDNRRINLRICTQAENARNRSIDRGRAFKGVEKKANRFRAMIRANGVRIRLGYFLTADEAARAYDRAAKQYHGAFARFNFPTEHVVPPLSIEDGEQWKIQIGDNASPPLGECA